MTFKNNCLTTKFFISIFSISLVIFVILLGKNIYDNAQSNIQRTESSLLLDINSSTEFISKTANTAIQTAYNISLNSELLTSGDTRRITDYLEQIIAYSSCLQNIYFYYEECIYSSDQILLDIYGNNFLNTIISETQYSPYMMWGAPYSTLIAPHVIPLIYCIGNRYDYGILVLELKCTQIENYFKAVYSAKDVDYIIYSNEISAPMYSSFPYLPADRVNNNNNILNQLKKIPAGVDSSSVLNIDNTKYYVFKSTPHPTINFCIIYQRNTINNIRPLLYNSLLIFIGISMLLIFTSYWISVKITAPINTFTQQLKWTYAQNSLPDTVANTYSGDIFEMVENYNNMVLLIKTLVKEKERTLIEKNTLEQQVLQHQISPHFLHNTLICIGNLAKQHKTPEVIQTLQSLLKLLPYSFDNTNTLVPLKSELENITCFIQILQVRYSQKFELKIKAEDSLLDFPVPKLILQPIVENAVYHGIIPKQAPGIIEVHVYEKDHIFCIDITDNGIGMENIDEKITQSKDNENRNFSIGLSNVIKRIKLLYGNGSDVKITSQINIGTTVHFRIQT